MEKVGVLLPPPGLCEDPLHSLKGFQRSTGRSPNKDESVEEAECFYVLTGWRTYRHQKAPWMEGLGLVWFQCFFFFPLLSGTRPSQGHMSRVAAKVL